MVPPVALLVLQLAIVAGSSWAAPPAAVPASKDHHLRPQPRLEALFSGAAAAATSTRSKRQPWMPTLIDSGDDSFAYRQHHQPPVLGSHQHQHAGGGGGGGFHQHRFHQPPQPPSPPEDFAFEDYADHPLDPDHSSAEALGNDNEIGDNPFYATPESSSPLGAGGPPPSGGGHSGAVESIDLIREQLERVKEEEDIEIKSELLMKLLEQLPEGPLPIVYIEDAGGSESTADASGTDGGEPSGGDPVGQVERFTANGDKRSGRYYRRYPWKRQNARSRTYDADARYLCVPSREDVFKLLVGLHENRIGNHQKTINFCNRKRPAKAIFTNIRFLG